MTIADAKLSMLERGNASANQGDSRLDKINILGGKRK
jgi:hypothetical protein